MISLLGLRLEYALEGSSSYIAWKDRMEVVFEDNRLKEFIDSDIPKPAAIYSQDLAANAQDLAAWKKNVVKARRILLEGVRDHIVLNIYRKETPYAMWKASTDLFQNINDHRMLVLKEKLRKIKMEEGETIPKHLTKFTQCRDELGSVGLTIPEDDLVSLELLSLPKSWNN